MSVVTIPGPSQPISSNIQTGNVQGFHSKLDAGGGTQIGDSGFHASILAYCSTYSDTTSGCSVNNTQCPSDGCMTNSDPNSCSIFQTGHCLTNEPSCAVKDGCGAFSHAGGCSIDGRTYGGCEANALAGGCAVNQGAGDNCGAYSDGQVCGAHLSCASDTSGSTNTPGCTANASTTGCSVDSSSSGTCKTYSPPSGFSACSAYASGTPACATDATCGANTGCATNAVCATKV